METYNQLTFGSAKKRLGIYGMIVRRIYLTLFIVSLVAVFVGLSYVVDKATDYTIKSQVYKNCVQYHNCDGFQPIKN